jgi:methylmalonyl-CoA mutase cobalamin-binding subunit
VVTTPKSQHHELPAMIVAATARSEGWRACYLGPNLPAEEIAAACAAPGASVLALSITYDTNDATLDKERMRSGRLVRKGVIIVTGYLAALNEMGATRIAELSRFRVFLRNQRGRA